MTESATSSDSGFVPYKVLYLKRFEPQDAARPSTGLAALTFLRQFRMTLDE